MRSIPHSIQSLKLNKIMKSTLTIVFTFVLFNFSFMAVAGDYFIRPVIGVSQLSNTQGLSTDIGMSDGVVDVIVDRGFNAGIGFGYHYTNNIAVELFWEYRTNDSQGLIDDGTVYDEGNYASNIFYMNGYYFFDSKSAWSPYFGLGLGWVQEIDIDFEQNGSELSYSESGPLAYQLFAGIEYTLSEHILVNAEFRFGSAAIGTLKGEENSGSISGFDYQAKTIQVGMKWLF